MVWKRECVESEDHTQLDKNEAWTMLTYIWVVWSSNLFKCSMLVGDCILMCCLDVPMRSMSFLFHDEVITLILGKMSCRLRVSWLLKCFEVSMSNPFVALDNNPEQLSFPAGGTLRSALSKYESSPSTKCSTTSYRLISPTIHWLREECASCIALSIGTLNEATSAKHPAEKQ